MLQFVFALCALLVSLAFADQPPLLPRGPQESLNNEDPCSISGTTTIGSYQTDSTPLPCKTFTGTIAAATGAVGAFALPGVEEIKGSLYIEAPGISSLDLGDLQRVDQLRIFRSSFTTMSFPNIQSIKEVDWMFMTPFQVTGGTKIKTVQRLSVSHTTIEDLSDVFDLETAEYIYIANNLKMENVTQPNLKTIGESLEIWDNAHEGAIAFPQLEWAGSLSISRVGHNSEFDVKFVWVNFPNLTEVRGDLAIRESPKIGKVNAPALTRVRGDLTVKDNTELVEVPFEGLKSVDGDLTYIGNFQSLASKVEHTIGKVYYKTDQDFNCRLYYGSGWDYEGGYYCDSASSRFSTDNPIKAPSSPYSTPTLTPTPTPGSDGSTPLRAGRLMWWELFILCLFLALFLTGLVFFERRRKKRWNAVKRLAIPVVNKASTVGTSRPRLASASMRQSTAYDDDAILPPPVTAMVPPPRYSDEFGKDAEKTELEREYRTRD